MYIELNETKAEVVDETLRLKGEGHSMKSGDFGSHLYRNIMKHFGGWKQCKQELGIKNVKTPPKRIKQSKYSDEVIQAFLEDCHRKELTSTVIYERYKPETNAISHRWGGLSSVCEAFHLPKFNKGAIVWDESKLKWTKQTIDATINELHGKGVKMSSFNLRSIGYSGMVSASKKFYGTWNKALQANGISPVKTMTKFNNKDDVASKYLADYKAGVKRGDITYRPAVKKYFGSPDALESFLGIDRTPITYDKDILDAKVYEIIAKESEKISAKILDSYDANISYSIRSHYGSITDYFSKLDVDYYAKPYVPFKWDAENTKRQLIRWIREGKPVNYTYVAMKHSGIIVASRKLYGGWSQLFEACGLNYDDYRTDTNMASFYGRKLEDIFEEILKESSVEYEREPHIENCKPDFVKGNDWIDVKLSEWTIHISDCDTLKKYEPHCETLTIVFLRGDKSLNKKITDKTRIVNIGIYIEQLPREKRGYFYERLDEIERELSEKEAV